MCRGEQWSSFIGQLLGLNEALSNGMDVCWGRTIPLDTAYLEPRDPTLHSNPTIDLKMNSTALL